MRPDPYRETPYFTAAVPETHPDRLASIATLFGMTPAPVTHCRVLEIGCGSGGNLIPMAYALPESRFTGVDLSDDAIAAALNGKRELGLPHLELRAMDLCDIGEDFGPFDYIIAHGVFSWVTDPVRDRLLAICRERLAPRGVAFISYNAFPGRHVRQMLREMMLHHTHDERDAAARTGSARRFLADLRQSLMIPPAWRPMIEDEVHRLLDGQAGWLAHDDLAPVNDSFYFRDFAARAARHSLQYLGEAEIHSMFHPANLTAQVAGDIVEQEQHLDFLCLRRFRQTLLCRAEVTLDRSIRPEQMDSFLFSSPAQPAEGGVEGFRSVRIQAPQYEVEQIAAALGEVYPLPVSFEELLEYAEDRESLRDILFAVIRSGFAQLHVHDFPCEQAVSARPRASRLARWESARSSAVTCAGHSAMQLEPADRALLELLDGAMEIDELARAFAKRMESSAQGERERLAERLIWLAGLGLLEHA